MSDAEELTYGRPSFGVMLDDGGEDGWRKQHAAQAWQAMQCWLLILCVQRVTVQRGLEMLAEQRDRHMSSGLCGAVGEVGVSNRPTEPGHYWIKQHPPDGGWSPCEVTDGWGDDELSVMPLGRDWSSPIDHPDFANCEWGPQLLDPDSPWPKVVEELCEENRELTASEANACAREVLREKERDAAVNGANLTVRTIVLALGGQPSEETNLVWILKRIEELRG